MRYKTKNFKKVKGEELQIEIGNWITTRDHIIVKSVNIWADDLYNYATIIYTEKQYNL